MKQLMICLFVLHVTHVCMYAHVPMCAELSLDEKIGQLLMIAVTSCPAEQAFAARRSAYNVDPEYINQMVRDYHVGGIIFLGAGTPEQQIERTQQLQALASYPLLVGLDAEWGLAMRHKGVITFPRAMTLGALCKEDDALIYALGKEVGRQCRAIGVHINFAPVVDVNNNPGNPIINTRSFGECPESVAHKAALYMKGMQDAGILTCAKHFPGHGDTQTDSHHARAVIMHDAKRLNAIELAPFKQLIKQGVDAIMTAHLDVPALSGGKYVPSTVSYEVITSLLRHELGFDGLIITDGLGMKGATAYAAPGRLEVEALKAGNDILLCPVDVPRAVACIKKALANGELTEQEIDAHVERILQAKRAFCSSPQQGAIKTLHTSDALQLKQKLYTAAITLYGDTTLPVIAHNKPLVVCTYGQADVFINALQKGCVVEQYALERDLSQQEQARLQEADQLIVSLHLKGRSGMIEVPSEHQTLPCIDMINRYADKITLLLFGSPYNLSHFPHVKRVIVAYENEPEAQEGGAETLLGLHVPTGILPVMPSRT